MNYETQLNFQARSDQKVIYYYYYYYYMRTIEN